MKARAMVSMLFVLVRGQSKKNTKMITFHSLISVTQVRPGYLVGMDRAPVNGYRIYRARLIEI